MDNLSYLLEKHTELKLKFKTLLKIFAAFSQLRKRCNISPYHKHILKKCAYYLLEHCYWQRNKSCELAPKILIHFYEINGNLRKIFLPEYVPEDLKDFKATWVPKHLALANTTPLEFYISCAYDSKLLFGDRRFADANISKLSTQYVHPCEMALHIRSPETLLLLLKYGAFLHRDCCKETLLKTVLHTKLDQTSGKFIDFAECNHIKGSSCTTHRDKLPVCETSAITESSGPTPVALTKKQISATISYRYLKNTTLSTVSTKSNDLPKEVASVMTKTSLSEYWPSMDRTVYTALRDSIAIYYPVLYPDSVALTSNQLKIILDTIRCANILLRAYASPINAMSLSTCFGRTLELQEVRIMVSELAECGLNALVNGTFSMLQLKHVCRCTIRQTLHENWKLPTGISRLKLSENLTKYLNLEID